MTRACTKNTAAKNDSGQGYWITLRLTGDSGQEGPDHLRFTSVLARGGRMTSVLQMILAGGVRVFFALHN